MKAEIYWDVDDSNNQSFIEFCFYENLIEISALLTHENVFYVNLYVAFSCFSANAGHFLSLRIMVVRQEKQLN